MINKKFSSLNVTKLNQPQNPITNLEGKLCLENQHGYSLIESPSGCGDFVKINSGKNKKLLD